MPRPIEADNLADLPGIRHGFFTRQGGVSTGIYAGLNCGLGSMDDRDKVLQNRARVALKLGSTDPAVLTPYQIHSAEALVVETAFETGDPPRADALVTRTPGLAIGILTADCGSVLLADPQARVVAAAHAGWRGAVGGILEATVRKMEELGARRDRIHAALGPCITQPNYEVGADFQTGLTDRNPAFMRYFATPVPGGKPHFDLPGFILAELAAKGLASIASTDCCTYANDSEFFSFRRTTHRKEPDYGRQISAILVA
ncbi:MAG: peptidoglycan editing factor PgeF [Alphaproteobacteria bacterium]|nr:peptidoglycan editing factor PgeF [Alphaproteobacteria bacterium]